MERQVWLAERRAALAADYDAGAAADGGEEYPWTCSGNGWPGCCA
jgi:hypothetical protein